MKNLLGAFATAIVSIVAITGCSSSSDSSGSGSTSQASRASKCDAPSDCQGLLPRDEVGCADGTSSARSGIATITNVQSATATTTAALHRAAGRRAIRIRAARPAIATACFRTTPSLAPTDRTVSRNGIATRERARSVIATARAACRQGAAVPRRPRARADRRAIAPGCCRATPSSARTERAQARNGIATPACARSATATTTGAPQTDG